MTREIKFRGKDRLTDKWVYGDLLHLGNAYAIVTSYEEEELDVNPISDLLEIRVENIAGVYPETVGQFTGLLDKNEKEIYLDDIVINEYGDVGCIIWYDNSIEIDWGRNNIHYYIESDEELEIIGNVFDNPELLKAETL